jgi:two-component system sensor histidine kinase KdpD
MDSLFSAEAKQRPTFGAGRLVPYLASLLLVVASTLAGAFLDPHWGNGPVDLLYLPAILACAILFGLWPALTASLASALAYNFFFTPPFHTFRMDRPPDIVTVAILFLVATVASKLAAAVREKAALAQSHASRNATVAGFAGRLLVSTGKAEIAQLACSELARVFGCNVAMIEGAPTPSVVASAPTATPLTMSDLATAAAVLELGESAGRGTHHPYPTDWQFHPVISNRKVLAAVGLVRDTDSLAVAEDQQPLLESLLDQVALALERSALEQQARDSAALRERDRVRSTLLASIGRDLRPSIDAIAGAVRELRRAAPEAKEAVAVVGSETTKLDRYLSNLAELDLDSEDLPLDLHGIRIDLAQRRVSREGVEVHLTPKEYAVLAELAKHPGRVLSHAHLLRAAWGPAQEGQTDYLRVAIRALRQKLERDPSQPQIIRNEPAVGYRLVT